MSDKPTPAQEAILRVFLLGYDAGASGLSKDRAALQFIADVVEPFGADS